MAAIAKIVTKNLNREPKISLVLYHLSKWSLISPLLHLCFRSKIYGVENVPRHTAVIIVSNHASDFDPPIVANCVGRPVAFMAKEELFKVPVLGRVIKLYGAYSVKRGTGDRAAIRAAIDSIEHGWATGIFLQGTRTTDGKITEPKLGAAMIAAKTNTPLLPMSIWGTDEIFPRGAKFPRFHPVTIRIGEVIPPPDLKCDRQELQAVTNRCANIINDLHALGR
jgi:1-acyl-sn-glycerol-3-phosphate acyltransferase